MTAKHLWRKKEQKILMLGPDGRCGTRQAANCCASTPNGHWLGQATLLPTHLPANKPEKAAEDGPVTWVPEPTWQTSKQSLAPRRPSPVIVVVGGLKLAD